MKKQNINYIKFETIDSTNLYLKEHYQELPTYSVVSAAYQMAGRGRLGRKWESDSDKNITASMLIKDLPNVANYSLITLVAGVAISKVLASKGIKVEIKWPNDIYYQDQKLAGILTEGITIDNKITAIIIGIGLNVNQTSFTTENEHSPISLKMITNKEYNIDSLIHDISFSLVKEINLYLNDDKTYLIYINDHLYRLKDHVKYIYFDYDHHYEITGTIIGVNSEGALLIENEEGIHKYKYGEINIQ